MLNDKNISRTPPCADGLSAWLVTIRCLLPEVSWWTVSFWTRTSSMGWTLGDTEDALTAVWHFAEGNHRVWNQTAAAAGSDACGPGNTRQAVAWITYCRWVAMEIHKIYLVHNPNPRQFCTTWANKLFYNFVETCVLYIQLVSILTVCQWDVRCFL